MNRNELEARKLEVRGISIAVADTGGAGPIVFFFHGLGWDHRMWREAFTRLHPPYRVVAGDTRGHGATSKPPGPYAIQQFTEDWQEVLDQLEIGRAALIGHSQGGRIAMSLAVSDPERFELLVLSSCTCKDSPQTRAQLDQRIKVLQGEGALESARMAAASIFSPRFVQRCPAIVDQFIRDRATVPQDAFISAIQAGRDFDLCDQLAKYHRPTLVIAGSDDRLVPWQATEELKTRLPVAEFALVPDSGHMVPIEQPEAFHGLVAEFLNQHDWSRSSRGQR